MIVNFLMNQRDHSIDILRGLAIFTMVAANMSAENYAEPHPFWFRIYGSFAAPTFVFLAGLMVSFTTFHKDYPVSYFLKRGVAVALVGALIDMACWHAVPFATFDVLYAIGISLPLAKLFLKLNRILQALVIVFCFAMMIVLQKFVGYNLEVTEPSLAKFTSEGWQGAQVWRQFLVDGWFPMFPWLGVSLLGAFIGNLRCSFTAEKASKYFAMIGAFLVIAGALTWIILDPKQVERDGYSELFYPPTVLFFLTFLGGVVFMLGVLYSVRENTFLKLFAVYGRSSLLMYLLHTTFNVYIFDVFFGKYQLHIFALLYLSHMIVLWVIAYFVQKFKQGKKLPFALSVVLGG